MRLYNAVLPGQARRSSPLVALLVLLGASAASTALADDDPSVVFVSRELSAASPENRTDPVTAARSGRLLLRAPDGRLRVLVAPDSPDIGVEPPLDVQDPDVSSRRGTVVFSGLSPTEGAWRLYEVSLDGGAARQITFTDTERDVSRHGEAARLLEGHDDLDPCYLPDGRICFVSTRYPGIAPDDRLRTTNLYVVNTDGSDLHRITTERFGADTPSVDPTTGRIVYSRWWRSLQTTSLSQDSPAEPLPPIPPGSPGYGAVVERSDGDNPMDGIEPGDFPGVNSWFLAEINPDGTGMSMHVGFGLDRQATQAWRPSVRPDGSILALFIPRTPLLGLPRGNGLRALEADAAGPMLLGGPQTFAAEDPASDRFVFASAAELGDGRVLVSATPSDRPGDYDLYIADAESGALSPFHSAAGTAELDAVAVLDGPAPPIVPDDTPVRLTEAVPQTVREAFARGGSFFFETENIFFNAPVDAPVSNAPPVGEPLAIEFYMAPQGTSTEASDPPLLIHRETIARDGKIRVELPAGVPLFEVLRRPDGTIPVGRDGQIFHVAGMNFGRAGETSRCVGCHAGHSMMAVPEDPSWTNLAPSAVTRANSTRRDADQRFHPRALIDRRTRSNDSVWQAMEGVRANTITLEWGVTVKARELVIYGTRDGDQVIEDVTIRTHHRGANLQTIEWSGTISPDGSRIPLASEPLLDGIDITFHSSGVTGSFESGTGPAIAEVEVIGKPASGPALIDPCGGIRSWNLLGPYHNRQGPAPSHEAIRRDYLADGDVTERTIEWAPGTTTRTPADFMPSPRGSRPVVTGHVSGNGLVNFMEFFRSNIDNAMVYAQAYITVERETTVRLGVSSDDSVQVLVNGEEVWIHSVPRALRDPCSWQDTTMPVTLREGVNSVVVKIFEGGGMWGFSLRLLDDRLQPLTDGFQVSLFPPAQPEPGALRFVRGDADGDSRARISDAIAILEHLFRPGTELNCLKSADVDDNGDLDLTDAVVLLDYLFRGGREPSAPFPECGTDTPGSGRLSCHFSPFCD